MSKILQKGDNGYGILIESDAGYISPDLTEFNKTLYENFLNEDHNALGLKNKTLLVDCILQKYGVENRNGRIYPKEVLIPQVEKYMQGVADNSAVSEADHPESSVVSLQNLSHIIKKIWWGTGNDENVLYGRLEIITSPAYTSTGQVCMVGDKIAEYLRRGIKLGISSRGVGSIKEVRGKSIVQPDFELICFDLVASPSTPGAYLFPKFGSDEVSESYKTNEQNNNDLIISVLDDFLRD